MSEETPSEETHATPEPASAGGPTAKAPGSGQVPTHVPPHLQALFTKHEGAVADRPGFRNKANARTKKQKKSKKARK